MHKHRAAARRSSGDQAFIWNLSTSEVYRYSQRLLRRSQRRRPAAKPPFPWFSPIE